MTEEAALTTLKYKKYCVCQQRHDQKENKKNLLIYDLSFSIKYTVKKLSTSSSAQQPERLRVRLQRKRVGGCKLIQARAQWCPSKASTTHFSFVYPSRQTLPCCRLRVSFNAKRLVHEVDVVAHAERQARQVANVVEVALGVELESVHVLELVAEAHVAAVVLVVGGRLAVVALELRLDVDKSVEVELGGGPDVSKLLGRGDVAAEIREVCVDLHLEAVDETSAVHLGLKAVRGLSSADAASLVGDIRGEVVEDGDALRHLNHGGGVGGVELEREVSALAPEYDSVRRLS